MKKAPLKNATCFWLLASLDRDKSGQVARSQKQNTHLLFIDVAALIY